MKAVVYMSEITIKGTDEVISIEEQQKRIIDFASKYNIEIVETFVDKENYSTIYMERNGFKALLDYKGEYDIVLMERIWSLTRKAVELKFFMDFLESRNKSMLTATTLWDCVSQVVRRRYKNTEKVIYGKPVQHIHEHSSDSHKKAGLSRLAFWKKNHMPMSA